MEALSPEIGRFTDVVSGAMQCRFCFALKLRPAFVDLPQPRWIGPDYWITRPRVAVVMLNPGSGTFRSDGADAALRSLLHAFAGGEDRLSEILEHQRRDIPSWGRGRFARFFLEGARLRLEQLALLNLAWCATQSNEYPPEMLHACFLASHPAPVAGARPGIGHPFRERHPQFRRGREAGSTQRTHALLPALRPQKGTPSTGRCHQ
jgi:hypothetical protein